MQCKKENRDREGTLTMPKLLLCLFLLSTVCLILTKPSTWTSYTLCLVVPQNKPPAGCLLPHHRADLTLQFFETFTCASLRIKL